MSSKNSLVLIRSKQLSLTILLQWEWHNLFSKSSMLQLYSSVCQSYLRHSKIQNIMERLSILYDWWRCRLRSWKSRWLCFILIRLLCMLCFVDTDMFWNKLVLKTGWSFINNSGLHHFSDQLEIRGKISLANFEYYIIIFIFMCVWHGICYTFRFIITSNEQIWVERSNENFAVWIAVLFTAVSKTSDNSLSSYTTLGTNELISELIKSYCISILHRNNEQ